MRSVELSRAEERARAAVLREYGLPFNGRAAHGVAAPEDGTARDLSRLVGLAAELCGAPYGVLNIITEDHQHQVAAAGIDPGICSREDSMCARVFLSGRTTVVPDASTDPRFTDNPFVTGALGQVRFYASVPLVTPSGHALGTLCVFAEEAGALDGTRQRQLETLAAQAMDILELQHRTRQLKATLRELQRSNDSLAAFAGRVSHDLRNPLAAILGYVELSEQDPDVPAHGAASGYLRTVAGIGRRMLTVLDDVLGFSRVGGTLQRTELSLAALVEDIRQDLHPAIRGAGGSLTCNDLAFVADAGQTRTLLQNLIANALSYGRPGAAPTVHVTGTAGSSGTVLRVIDRGKGIPAHERRRVQEPLVRLHRDGDGSGSGLGLATCARIAEAHGGSLDIGETAGGGTTVTVSFPAG
ncbi:GAF domain-containing sensor histidine kinase [Paenarthrobacter sp. DKR-5]|uniref:GAF domain-containing sensor histidine kinase n=1 Tax=Paenarthrobacter sp. DKR-5 TaxID=2835535 RepID=UPI001BDBEA36|nr:GAF domain-containing sensor histidine kinase [Paenarthrobacter sp. DKR-5]MBT1004347.1 GAF domain-containing sensor histidine kinase [Paenarthrobacter sp. DKR-5]